MDLGKIKDLKLEKDKIVQILSGIALLVVIICLGYSAYNNLVSRSSIQDLIPVVDAPAVSADLDTSVLKSAKFQQLEANGTFPLTSDTFGNSHPFLK